MGWIWTAFTKAGNWLVTSRIGHWIAIALGAVGLNFVAQEALIDPVLDVIKSNLQGGPGMAVQWFGFFNVDKYITLILSAYAARGATGWAIKRMK